MQDPSKLGEKYDAEKAILEGVDGKLSSDDKVNISSDMVMNHSKTLQHYQRRWHQFLIPWRQL